jgi:PKD repeat protein
MNDMLFSRAPAAELAVERKAPHPRRPDNPAHPARWITALVLAVAVGVATTAAGSVIGGPVPYGGHNYYLLSAQTWGQAETEANALGGHLVTINNPAEQDFVFELASGWVIGHWLGFSDQAEEGNWIWASGEPVTYTNWNVPWEPNNYGGIENCGVLEVDWSGRWNDLPCGWVRPAVAETPGPPCEIHLWVPIYDGQTWAGGCNARVNGVVLTDPGCPGITRIQWDWGDGLGDDQWFPAAHSYDRSGTYTVTVTPLDADGNSVSSTTEVELTTCDPFGTIDPVLYATDFQTLAYGTINGHDEWTVGVLSYPGSPTPFPWSEVGQVVDTGSGQRALQVRASSGWGDEVGRFYPTATRRFLAIAFDFQTPNDGDAGFWFMDSKEHGQEGAQVRSLFFWPDWLRSNSIPGIGATSHQRDWWYRTGIEIDRDTSRIVAFFFDGAWQPDDSSQSTPVPPGFNLFYFNTYAVGQRLWVDNLRVSECDAPTSSRSATVALASTISGLQPAVFANPNQQNALAEKLDQVFVLISAGQFAEAHAKLVNDVRKKTDGCVTGGAPDANDWIKSCSTQEKVYPQVLAAIDLLAPLR